MLSFANVFVIQTISIVATKMNIQPVVVVVVVVAPGRPTGFTPYPTMDSLSAFSSDRQVFSTSTP